jgi:hypothetical protein
VFHQCSLGLVMDFFNLSQSGQNWTSQEKSVVLIAQKRQAEYN